MAAEVHCARRKNGPVESRRAIKQRVSNHSSRVARPDRYRGGALLLALLCAVGAGALWLREPNPGVEPELRAMAAAISAPPGDQAPQRRQRIEAAIERYLADNARLQIAELPALTAPNGSLADALVGLVAEGEEAHVELTRVEVEVSGDHARALVDARLSGDVGRDLHAPHRQLTLQLVRTASGWKIVHVSVPARRLEEPEPRP